jgi:hypothetical protein
MDIAREVIAALKNGQRARQLVGTATSDMFYGRILVPGRPSRQPGSPSRYYPEGTSIEYHAHVDMKTAQGYVVPWLCSQADLRWQMI